MHDTLLTLHNWTRWPVLILGLVALYRAYVGWTGRKPFAKADNGISAAFSGFLWLQVLIGLGLYFGDGPWGLTGLKAFGMKNATARFFGMEHPLMMIIAAALAQVGRVAMKKASDDALKHKKLFVYFGIALLIILVMIPWGIWNPAARA
jgi:hypothetical protein